MREKLSKISLASMSMACLPDGAQLALATLACSPVIQQVPEWISLPQTCPPSADMVSAIPTCLWISGATCPAGQYQRVTWMVPPLRDAACYCMGCCGSQVMPPSRSHPKRCRSLRTRSCKAGVKQSKTRSRHSAKRRCRMYDDESATVSRTHEVVDTWSSLSDRSLSVKETLSNRSY